MSSSTASTTSETLPSRCPGLALELPPHITESPYGLYPFGLHTLKSLPWNTLVTENGIFLVSKQCTGIASIGKGQLAPCRKCCGLARNDDLLDIQKRICNGCPETLQHPYRSHFQLVTLLEQRRDQLEVLRLRGLNMGRKLTVKCRSVDVAKQVLLVMSRGDVPGASRLLRVALRNGAGLMGVLEKFGRAIERLSDTCDPDEANLHRAFLFAKLGGAQVAQITQRSLGMPSARTATRRLAVHPLRASPGYPTSVEIEHNLAIAFPTEVEDKNPHAYEEAVTLFADELKLEERLRWDAPTNHILGVCREHCRHVSLEFRSMAQADALHGALTNPVLSASDRVHLATEATVVAMRVLSDNARRNSARPVIVSGTCKREGVEPHRDLLAKAIDAFNATAGSRHQRLYSIATDGDSRRRRAVALLTLQHHLFSTSLIHCLLEPLRLFNFLCGEDDVTGDFDYKHVIKRFRNTLLRHRGITISGVTITPSIIEKHLLHEGESARHVHGLLSPNDRQDVPLAYSLLLSISGLSYDPESLQNQPPFATAQRVLRLMGHVYRHLLEAYTNVQLSLGRQLQHLSAVTHLCLALYAKNKGGFMPVQLYYDVVSMIKNAYFCVAKAIVANPDGKFYLILLGTDSLETLFGIVRTMTGNDTNADQLQLASRLTTASLCSSLLQLHPTWDRGPRRLGLPTLKPGESSVSRKYDHINPASWKGDVSLSKVVLLTSWQLGKQDAIEELGECSETPPFEGMESSGGYDILCPFGNDRLVLIGGINTGEREEDDEERDEPTADIGDAPAPDLEDLVSSELTEGRDGDERSKSSPRYSAWIPVDGDDSKPQHKACILRVYSKFMSIQSSKDRLRRINGLSVYNESSAKHLAQSFDTDTSLFDVHSPVLTIVRCNGHIFLAAALVIDIRVNNTTVQAVPSDALQEPNVRFKVQLM
ncbi:hypothetical protein OE88DRAFT_1639531 [Heliocybe sulcata]|uniref:Uncharacterized protein n=1 Tax=Heliocybe sulcata TaxID=5364 RepID=A0A5C3MMY6_9AGAM|nr:hypothetical protein OE88DRAFT_1639531 [Heliocybe sulcata]